MDISRSNACAARFGGAVDRFEALRWVFWILLDTPKVHVPAVLAVATSCLAYFCLIEDFWPQAASPGQVLFGLVLGGLVEVEGFGGIARRPDRWRQVVEAKGEKNGGNHVWYVNVLAICRIDSGATGLAFGDVEFENSLQEF